MTIPWGKLQFSEYYFDISPMAIKPFKKAIANNKTISYAKTTHGFWDKIPEYTKKMLDPTYEVQNIHWRGVPEGHNKGMVDLRDGDVPYWAKAIYLLRSPPFPGFYSASFNPSFKLKNIRKREMVPKAIADPLVDLGLMEALLKINWYDPHFWKRAVCNGKFTEFINFLRKQKVHVIMVGPEHLAGLQDEWKIRNFTHVDTCFNEKHLVIHNIEGRTVRRKMMRKLKNTFHNTHLYPVCFLQTGAVAGLDIIHTFGKNNRPKTIIDAGLALNAWFDRKELLKSSWLLGGRGMAMKMRNSILDDKK